MRLPKILQNKVAQNAGWIVCGSLMNKALAFFVSILSTRYLGPDNYGLINYAAAYTTFFASLCTLGINSVIVKNFADYPDEEGTAIGTTLLLRAMSSFLSAVAIVGIVFVMDYNEPLTIAVVALYSFGLVFQIFDTFNYWFQSKLKSKYSAIASTIAYAVVSLYKILLLITGKSVLWFAVTNAIDYIAVALLLYGAYRKNNGPKLSVSKAKAKELLRPGSSFIISGLMVSIYAGTDKLMLKQMLDKASVGYYSLASSFSMMWAFILQAIIDSMYPLIVQERNVDLAGYERKNRQLYAIVFYISVAMSAIITLLAKPLFLFLYGEAYLPAVAPLRIIVWYTAFSYLGVARNAWMVCENRQCYLKYLYVSAALINVVLNWFMIPSFGASGAAAASLITQISTTTLLPALIRPLRPNAKLMWEAMILKDVLPKKEKKG